MHHRYRNAIWTLVLWMIFCVNFRTSHVSQVIWIQALDILQVETSAASAIKPVEKTFIPSHKARIPKKHSKKSIWKRLKLRKKNKVAPMETRSANKYKSNRFKISNHLDWGLWILAFIMTLSLGILLLYLLLYVTAALIFNGLHFLAIIVFFFGLFGLILTIRALWRLFTHKTDSSAITSDGNLEDVIGMNSLHPEPNPEDIPRFQSMEVNKQEVTLCIYPTQSGNAPVKVKMRSSVLMESFTGDQPECFDLRLTESESNQIHFETLEENFQHKELLRIVVEDGDIAREIFVRKGGVLELLWN